MKNLTENSIKVLQARYLKKNDKGEICETPEELFRRVALTVAEPESKYGKTPEQVKEIEEQFFDMMTNCFFMPNSPTLMNAGREMSMLSACFVLPVEDSIDGIFDSIKHTALIQKAGGGTGFSFSKLRPKGDIVKSSGGTTSGPISFLKVFSQATEAIQQGAFRRGANMGVMRIDHPDIIEFIEAKKDLTQFTNYNLSVAVTDEFMESLLKEPNSTHYVVNPRNKESKPLKRDENSNYTKQEVWQLILDRAWETGEPGILFIDRANQYNPTPHIGEYEATNPCLAGDNFVLTTFGWKMIQDLVGVRTDLRYGNSFYSTTEQGFFSSGIKKVFKLTTKSGTMIRLTEDHKLMRSDGEMICAKDFKIGDKLININFDYVSDFESLIPDGEEEVFDCQVPGPNKFICKGFVVANCGEQWLLPYEACNLGSINLSKFVNTKLTNPYFDFIELSKTVITCIRFLDNIIDANKYPLPQIHELCHNNRKIGLGVMGFADALYKMNIAYNSKNGVAFGESVMRFIQNESHKASEQLAKERGVFPNWKGSRWENEWNREVRNACSTTVAPTGTISIIANCSGGIEPMFSLAFQRNVLNGQLLTEVNEVFEQVAKEKGFYSKELIERIAKEGSIQHIKEIPESIREVFVTARDIKPEWHLRMQAAFQKHCDSSISKTINFDHSASKEDIKSIYNMAFDLKLKGVTIYRDGCRANQPMALKKEDKPLNLLPLKVPEIMSSIKVRQSTPFGNMHVQIIIDMRTEKELEVFAQLGKGGDLASSDLEAICRLLSLYLRSNGKFEIAIAQLDGIGSSLSIPSKEGRIQSLADGLAKGLQKYLNAKETFGLEALLLGKADISKPPEEKVVKQNIDNSFKIKCPECESFLTIGEGCAVCKNCGYAKC